jgi:uroporphyrinogen-III synthase
MNSEALLQAPALQAVAGEKILIMRGLGGRTHLGDALCARGAQVDYCELYERRLPPAAMAQMTAALNLGTKKTGVISQINRKNLVTIVTLHSGEALQNLRHILPALACAPQQPSLVVPSERIAQQATAAGFNKVYTAPNATEAAMLQALMRINHYV